LALGRERKRERAERGEGELGEQRATWSGGKDIVMVEAFNTVVTD